MITRFEAASLKLTEAMQDMTTEELEAELNAVWHCDWHHPKTMVPDELRAEVARVWERKVQ